MTITGKDLVEWGYRPGKWFKDALDYANQSDMTMDTLRTYLDANAPFIIDPFAEGVKYHKNIRSQNDEEEANAWIPYSDEMGVRYWDAYRLSELGPN